MAHNKQTIWLAAGVRTPFVPVDGRFAHRDIGSRGAGHGAAGERPNRFRGMGVGFSQSRLRQSRAPSVAGRQTRSHVPTFTTIMQCST